MSKRPFFNRQRVISSARPRRLVSTFVPVLIGLSGLTAPSIPYIVPILPGTSPLFAQSPSLSAERSAVDAPSVEPNQVVFFSIPVAVDAAIVRSGPSEDAYPTGTVGKNRYVEAYFRDADGWCAIRPPQGSFSWINAKFVRRENDSTGRVVASNGKAVPARVGGATVESSGIVQVGLKNGRQIKILGETRLTDGSTWLKIAPPSGEFRWLHSSALLDDPAIAQLPSKLTFQREFLNQLAQNTQDSQNNLNEQNTQNGQNGQNRQNASFSETASPLANAVPETLPASVVASGAAGSTQSAASSQSLQNAQFSQNASTSFAAALPDAAQTTLIPHSAQTTPTAPSPQTSLSAQTAPSNASEEFATQIKMEIARLNGDVFQTLRQNHPSDAELAALASRAEYLFDAAPTDGERFVVQSIYDAIKIAERRNRSRLTGGDAAQPPRSFPILPQTPVSPISPAAPNSSAPNGTSYLPHPAQSSRPSFSLPSDAAAGRLGGFEVEGDLPTLVLPDSNFDASVPADSSASTFDAASGFNLSQFAQNADFNSQNGWASPWNAANFNQPIADAQFGAPNQTNAPLPEKRPRLAFAFSDANNPFRSRTKSKEVRVAPLIPQSSERSSGLLKLPPLLPTQKQLIVPPPNYRTGPFGKNERNDAKNAASTAVASSTSRLSSEIAPSTATVGQTAQNNQTAQTAQKKQTPKATQAEQAAQELTVDSVRWRAVETNAIATSKNADDADANVSSTVSSTVSSDAVSLASSVSSEVSNAVAATKIANVGDAPDAGDGNNAGKVSPIGATVPSKPLVLVGASVPQRAKKSLNANPNERPKTNKNSNKNNFQPVASRSVSSFDAYGVLAKLPKAPKGTPQYALTRPVGERFEIVSYLEAGQDVSLERYVGRKIGVKGTRGTIQIGENTQRLTTVQTVFPQE